MKLKKMAWILLGVLCLTHFQPVFAEDLYCVIDLSGGPTATRYPISYLDAVPSGGWSDEYKTTKLVLRRIEAGTFMMGSPTGEIGSYDGEDQHVVTLSRAFYIGVFEITQRQWELVMGGNPSYFTNAVCCAKRPVERVSYYDIRGSADGNNWPASSTADVTSFIGKLRAKAGLEMFDLPTEAQWEYACRAGTVSALNNGKNLTNATSDAAMDEVGRYGCSSWRGDCDTSSGTADVGSYKPNAWGLYDMHGNVWEWCLDWLAWDFLTEDRVDATDPVGEKTGGERAYRGGCFYNDASKCRSSSRSNHGTVYPGNRTSDFGLRIAIRDLPIPSGRVRTTFDANGGETAVYSQMYNAGSRYTSLPSATWKGYEFLGWFTAAVGGQVVTADSNASSDITLYAHWNQVYEPPTYVCNVTFDANGGSGTTRRDIVSGKSVGTLPVATREGYTFVGWFTSPEGGSAITSATVVTSSISFYAHWTENSTPPSAPDPEPAVDYDEQISEWSSSLSYHHDPTAVWVDDEEVYLDEVELPYTYQCGAVLHKTKGGYRLDLPGIDITDLCIQANGDLAILVTGENIIRVNSNRGDFNVERMPGMFYSGIYAHNMLVFGPGSLTIIGEVRGMGILSNYGDGNVKIAAGTTVTFQDLGVGIECAALELVLAKLRLSGVGPGACIDAGSVFMNCSCVAGTCSGEGICSSSFLHIYQSLVDLQCTKHCLESYGATQLYQSYVTLLSWEQNGILSYGDVVMMNSSFSAYAGDRSCGICASQSLKIGEGRYTIATGEGGAGIRGGYVLLAGGDVEVCAPDGSGCFIYTGPYSAASNLVYSGSFKTSEKIDIKELLTINLESAAIYGAASALFTDDCLEFAEDVSGKLLMSGVNTLATSFRHGRPKYGIQMPYDGFGTVYQGLLNFWNGNSANGYVEIDGGTVSVGNAEIGVQVPLLLICGGSYHGSYSLYNGIKPITAWVEGGQTVVKALKCVEEQFPSGKEGDRITSGWKTQLPSYYGTRSLYLDDERKLYFWIPEDSQGGGGISVVTVRFDANGGSVNEEARTCSSGKAVGTLPTPTRAKYKFDGWYTAATGGTKVTASTKVTADVTYYAHWTYDGKVAVSAALGFGCEGMGTVSGGGTVAAGKSVTVKATARSAKKATKTAAAQTATVFAGWYLDAACTVKATGSWLSPTYAYVAGEDDIKFYAKFLEQAEDVAAVSFEMPDELTTGVTAVNATVDVSGCSSLPTVKVSGLPTGLKFTAKDILKKGSKTEVEYAANTIYGTPTKSGVYAIVVTVMTAGRKSASRSQTVVVRKADENVVKTNVALVDAKGVFVSADVVPGKASGSGVYAVGKKVTLKATANKGYVFVGWRIGGVIVDRNASYGFSMPDADRDVTALFITAADDKANIFAGVCGRSLDPWVSKQETHAYRTNVWAGVYLEWPVAVRALSATSVKVSGLPSGLKFASKDVVDAKTKRVMVPANTIYGAPSTASKQGKASAIKITVTTAGKSTSTFEIDATVLSLPAWAQGTYAGGWASDGDVMSGGQVTLTSSAAGKISGKALGDGVTYTLVAPYYSEVLYLSGGAGADGLVVTNFRADVTASWTVKVGSRSVKTNETFGVWVRDEGIGGIATTLDWFYAYKNGWKTEPWKSIAKALEQETRSGTVVQYYVRSDGKIVDGNEGAHALDDEYVAMVTLKFAANGVVKETGEFVSGYDAKKRKYVTVKASGSTVAVPTTKNDGLIFVYLTPKGLSPYSHVVRWGKLFE